MDRKKQNTKLETDIVIKVKTKSYDELPNTKKSIMDKVIAIHAKDKRVKRGEYIYKSILELLFVGGFKSAMALTGTEPEVIAHKGILYFRPDVRNNVYAAVYLDAGDLYRIDYIEVDKTQEKTLIKLTYAGVYNIKLREAYINIFRDFTGNSFWGYKYVWNAPDLDPK